MNTTFVDGVTPIVAAWLNDVNAATYAKQSGSVVLSASGFASPTSVTVNYSVSGGGIATLDIQNILGASNSNDLVLSALPAVATPVSAKDVQCLSVDASNPFGAYLTVNVDGTITVHRDVTGNPFNVFGNKGLKPIVFSYNLN